jgi:DNA-binding PadR family transcriptional regulator
MDHQFWYLTAGIFTTNMAFNDISLNAILVVENKCMETEEYLPLQEATTLILICLAEEPRHGYAILKEVEALSHGRVIFSTGTLYGALARLLDQGLVERLEDEEATGRARKSYRLTSLGRKVLTAEMARLEQLTQLARLRLIGESA